MIARALCVPSRWTAEAAGRVAMVGQCRCGPFLNFAPPKLQASDIACCCPAHWPSALVGLLEAISIGRPSRSAGKSGSMQPGDDRPGLSNSVGGFFQCYAGLGRSPEAVSTRSGGCDAPVRILSSVFLAGHCCSLWITSATFPCQRWPGFILYVAWRLIDIWRASPRDANQPTRNADIGHNASAGLLRANSTSQSMSGVIASFAVFIYESSHPAIRVSAPVPSTPQGVENSAMQICTTSHECPPDRDHPARRAASIRLGGACRA
jgi:SulP family sulfate permease